MKIKPEIAWYRGQDRSPVYVCRCGKYFSRLDLLSNKLSKGTREYCPNCKVKFVFNK